MTPGKYNIDTYIYIYNILYIYKYKVIELYANYKMMTMRPINTILKIMLTKCQVIYQVYQVMELHRSKIKFKKSSNNRFFFN